MASPDHLLVLESMVAPLSIAHVHLKSIEEAAKLAYYTDMWNHKILLQKVYIEDENLEKLQLYSGLINK